MGTATAVLDRWMDVPIRLVEGTMNQNEAHPKWYGEVSGRRATREWSGKVGMDDLQQISAIKKTP